MGENAEFREDQWEAIKAVLDGKRTLVVEKTGWGKSIVYFIATKLLREQGRGMSLLVSPLLSLMRNQIEAAERIGLRALSINSNNKEDWLSIESAILSNNCDILLISPERLANETPRKQWSAGIIGESKKAIPKEFQNEAGRVLCNYGDAGWGKHVSKDKYIHGCFREELVDASVELIKGWEMENRPTWVTSVPSLRRPKLVKDFATRIAKRLNIPYVGSIIKQNETDQQKTMENSYQQAKNARKGFEVTGVVNREPVLLIDDMVDSKWTLTVCGVLLKEAGVSKVYPFAIASTAEGGLD